MAKTKKISNYPSVLSFEKKLIPSDGYFYSTSWADRHNHKEVIGIREMAFRGIVESGNEQQLGNINMQGGDVCFLPAHHDTLRVDFALSINSGLENPAACNNTEFEIQYRNLIKIYTEKHGFDEIARRYAINIANARFLWRNRLSASDIEVVVHIDGTELIFDAYEYSLKHFNFNDSQILALTSKIADALSGKTPRLLLMINCYAKLINGHEVFPSQELVLHKEKTQKSKILYKVEGQAAYHSQKIGNALRTIDNWYLETDDDKNAAMPISVEAYGTVTSKSQVLRGIKSKIDFHTLFQKYVEQGELDSPQQEHYVTAMLIRGGVFGIGD